MVSTLLNKPQTADTKSVTVITTRSVISEIKFFLPAATVEDEYLLISR
jgi:hypothetical protein